MTSAYDVIGSWSSLLRSQASLEARGGSTTTPPASLSAMMTEMKTQHAGLDDLSAVHIPRRDIRGGTDGVSSRSDSLGILSNQRRNPGGEQDGDVQITDEDSVSDASEEKQPIAPYHIVERLKTSEWKREVGDEGVWTLSSAKPGNGAEQLRDGDPETFWQSDGSHPHLINIHFHKKMRLQEVALYLDHRLDESYTPAKISIRVGTDLHDIEEVQCVDLDAPQGWVIIPIGASLAPYTTPYASNPDLGICRAHVLQIAILASHQNGRDTHVRQIKIFAPRENGLRNYGLDLPGFTSLQYEIYSTIR